MSDLSPECALKQTASTTLNYGFMPWFLTLVCWYAPPRVICPSCQFAADLSACDVGQITGMFPRVFCPPEGRFAIVTKRGARDAVDAGCRETSGADPPSLKLRRDWYQDRRLAFVETAADGEVVAS